MYRGAPCVWKIPYSTYLLACDPSVGAEHGRSGFGFALGWLSRTDGSVNRIDCGWFDTSQANRGPECHRSTLGGRGASPPGARRLGAILRGLMLIFGGEGVGGGGGVGSSGVGGRRQT